MKKDIYIFKKWRFCVLKWVLRVFKPSHRLWALELDTFLSWSIDLTHLIMRGQLHLEVFCISETAAVSTVTAATASGSWTSACWARQQLNSLPAPTGWWVWIPARTLKLPERVEEVCMHVWIPLCLRALRFLYKLSRLMMLRRVYSVITDKIKSM